jgi:uncharacterized protein
MADDERIPVAVVYARPEQQVIVELDVPAGTSVAEAVARSGLPERFPEISGRPLACAIYGRPVALASVVRAADRIEILRPLLIDPKESRRQAAGRGRPGQR